MPAVNYPHAQALFLAIKDLQNQVAALQRQQGNLITGTGSPAGLAGTAGLYFLRTDTPGVANQRLYVCTVAGAAGSATWVGIL